MGGCRGPPCDWGVADRLETRLSSTCVIMPYVRRSTGENEFRASRLSRSLKVIGTDTNRLPISGP